MKRLDLDDPGAVKTLRLNGEKMRSRRPPIKAVVHAGVLPHVVCNSNFVEAALGWSLEPTAPTILQLALAYPTPDVLDESGTAGNVNRTAKTECEKDKELKGCVRGGESLPNILARGHARLPGGGGGLREIHGRSKTCSEFAVVPRRSSSLAVAAYRWQSASIFDLGVFSSASSAQVSGFPATDFSVCSQ